MLGENDLIITESESVAKIFNKYFNEIAEGIGFNDPIPENFDSDEILLSMIKSYDNHPSIRAIKKPHSRTVIWFCSCYPEWCNVLYCKSR